MKMISAEVIVSPERLVVRKKRDGRLRILGMLTMFGRQHYWVMKDSLGAYAQSRPESANVRNQSVSEV